MSINFDDEMEKYNNKITAAVNIKSTDDVVGETPLPTTFQTGDDEYNDDTVEDIDNTKSATDTINETPLPTTFQTGDDEYNATKPLGILEKSVAPTNKNSAITKDLKTNVQDVDIKSANDEISAANVLSLTEYKAKISDLKEILRADDLIPNSDIITDLTIETESTEETAAEETERLAAEALAEYDTQLEERAEAVLDALTSNTNTLTSQRIQSEMKLEIGREKSDSLGDYSVDDYNSNTSRSASVSRLNLVGETTPAIDEVVENGVITTAGVAADTDGETNTDTIDLNKINSEESTDNTDVRDNVITEGDALTDKNVNIKSVDDTIDVTPLPTTFQTGDSEYTTTGNKGSNVSRLNLKGETTPAIDEVVENGVITTAGVAANTDGETNTDGADLNKSGSEESTDNTDVRDNVITEGDALTNKDINIKSVDDTIDVTPLPTTFQTGDSEYTTENSGAVVSRKDLKDVDTDGEINTESMDDRSLNVVDTPKELIAKSAFENKINYDGQDGIFQPVGSDEDIFDAMTDIASRSVGFIGADLPKATFNKDNVNLDGFSRFENSITNDGMRFFLFDNIPYQVGKTASVIGSAAKLIADEAERSDKNGTLPSPNLAISATRSAMSLLSHLSYFKWDELLWSLAITNTTLSGGGFIGSPLKGMTVKKYKTNILKGTSVEDFDGAVDLDFNDTPGATDKWLKKVSSATDSVANFFTKDGKETVNPQELMGEIKPDKTPKELKSEIDNQLAYSRYGNEVTGYENGSLQEGKTLVEMEKSKYSPSQQEREIDLYSKSFLGTHGFRSHPTKNKIEEENVVLEDISVLTTTFKGDKLNTGSVYVYPLAGESSTISNFKIPFQFTPVITESGQAAKYESASMLHRTGSISSYVNTEGESLTLETNYMMLDDGKKTAIVNGNPTNSWNTFWTPETVPAIERMFRSLVLPFSGDTKRAFSKPPVVKIVFDKTIAEVKVGKENNNEIYSMLKYPIGDTGKYYHRTYVVTKVTIFKDLKESPLLMNEDGTIRDTHGFKLNMELMEIDYNYINSLPEFGEYYNSYSSSLKGNEAFKV